MTKDEFNEKVECLIHALPQELSKNGLTHIGMRIKERNDIRCAIEVMENPLSSSIYYIWYDRSSGEAKWGFDTKNLFG